MSLSRNHDPIPAQKDAEQRKKWHMDRATDLHKFTQNHNQMTVITSWNKFFSSLSLSYIEHGERYPKLRHIFNVNTIANWNSTAIVSWDADSVWETNIGWERGILRNPFCYDSVYWNPFSSLFLFITHFFALFWFVILILFDNFSFVFLPFMHRFFSRLDHVVLGVGLPCLCWFLYKLNVEWSH